MILKNAKRLGIPLILVSLVAIPLAALSTASAHGPPPGGCASYYDYEYPAQITAFTVESGGTRYDIMANPGITVQVNKDDGFKVDFTLRADELGFSLANGTKVPANSSGAEGYAWYRDTANGYPFSKCAGPLKGGEDFQVSTDYPVGYMFQGQGPHQVIFETSLDDSRPHAEFYVDVTGTTTSANETLPDSPPSEPVQVPFLTEPGQTSTSGEPADNGSLAINGTIASLAFDSNASSPSRLPIIISGTWSMNVNATHVSDFQANLTTVSADGEERASNQIRGFAPADTSAISFENGSITIPSSAVITTNGSSENVTLTITLASLNAIRLELSGSSADLAADPVYGIVDKLTVTEAGQVTRVISR